MEALFLLFVFLVVLTVIAVLGHAIWLMCEAVVRGVSPNKETPTISPASVVTWACETCCSAVRASWAFCGDCGTPRDTKSRSLRDLAATKRQLESFRNDNKIALATFQMLNAIIEDERIRLTKPQPVNIAPKPPQQPHREAAADKLQIIELPTIIETETQVQPAFFPTEKEESVRPKETTPPPQSPRAPRRSFSEVLNAFMEESNIRWGEIIGGLLIIGCSTALVVSLWSQISQIPVLKFLIFTTVTAVLFGIGMYTEHRWKLPTTSRGILTIGTLLVPLNFLAIAAVSSSETSGALVLASEFLAPAIFLCLVYFAGRVITPRCSHLLAAGVLGSSVGQLLVRHFVTADSTSFVLVLLGAFPVLCYVIAVGLALRLVLHDGEVDKTGVTTLFTILGTQSFAALLPFGLLLYKAGPFWMSIIYLAPVVTLWGLPLLATGTVLWRRIQDKTLIASRTTGTALGILGLMIALTGMILAWPNPASIISAALINFAILTTLALVLEIPAAHFFAAGCFGMAYLVLFHVLVGHISWENLRVTSLVNTCLDISSGQALIGAFGVFLVISEWFQGGKRRNESYAYLTAACLVAVISLAMLVVFGPVLENALQSISIAFLIYSVAAFWIAWRRRLSGFTWIAASLFLFSLASFFAWNTGHSFPWQTALLTFASLGAVAAIAISKRADLKSVYQPLNHAALICLIFAVGSLFQTNPWQVTSVQAERVFWMAAICLVSLWLNRRLLLLTAFQIGLTAGAILTVKAVLQEYEWYTYLPHAFMHPSALQIQGTVLALLSLIWIAVRVVVRKRNTAAVGNFWKLLDTPYSIDRLIPWVLLAAFVFLSIYGAASGVLQEFAPRGSQTLDWNIAGFPHREAFALGSWIVLGLLTIIMLANAWERRQRFYLLGAVTAICCVIPLLAGRFESQLATATAWRFLAAVFVALGSVLFWFRESLQSQLTSFGAPTFDAESEPFVRTLRELLMVLTVGPLLLLTFYPALRALSLEPLQVPTSGVFALLGNEVSYALPLTVVALVLIGYSVRERAPLFSFYAGLLFNTTVTLAYLLSVASSNAALDSVAFVRVTQLNVITFGVYGLFWLSLRKKWFVYLESRAKQAESLLKLQMWLALGCNLALVTTTLLGVLFGDPSAYSFVVGDSVGWLALVTSFVGFVLVEQSRKERLPVLGVISILVSALSLFVFRVPTENFQQLRALMVGMTVCAWLTFVASLLKETSGRHLQRILKLDSKWSSHSNFAATVLGCVACYLALRQFVFNRQDEAWWSIGPVVGLCALAASLQVRTLKRTYLYIAGILLTLALSMWWIAFVLRHDFSFTHFVEVNIIGACITSVLWLYLELRARRLKQDNWVSVLSYHNLVAIGSVVWLFTCMLLTSYDTGTQLLWWAWFATTVLMFSTLWDPRAKYAMAGLYTLGLVAFAIGLRQMNLTPKNQAWSIIIFLSGYALGTALLWRNRSRFIQIASRAGIVPRIDSHTTQLTWVSAVSILLVVIVTLLGFVINVYFFRLEFRVTAAIAVAAQAITLGLLAEGTSQGRWRRGAIAAFLIGVVLLGWAWLTPYVTATWINRSVILLVETAVLTLIVGLFNRRIRELHEDWSVSISSALPAVLLAGCVALFFSLGVEVSQQLSFGVVLISPLALVAIAAVLITAAVVPVCFAISPAHDPLSLSERGHMKYVYVAELMLALLFLHIRLTMPWLFAGFFERYWPFVVMAIAFGGVLASEALRRRNVLVLAQPIERTGAFLPLLPVIGFWIATSEVDYSSLLFVVGGLYGLLSSLRRSFVFGMLAAIAGNAGLWYVLHRTEDYQFLQHPQLWLVPAALSVLLAAYLNEDRFSEDQMAGIRYLSLVTIYASSTADIFINGVANSPWLPLILGAFSLAGVFSGIMFKIRGLLLLGSVFLLLSITTMIWYASVNFGWTWLWYVAGIATGATIIFMFAVFEKKRSEVLRVVDGLKEWEV